MNKASKRIFIIMLVLHGFVLNMIIQPIYYFLNLQTLESTYLSNWAFSIFINLIGWYILHNYIVQSINNITNNDNKTWFQKKLFIASVQKGIRSFLILHAFFFNIVGFLFVEFMFHPDDTLSLLFLWAMSIQLNLLGIFYYKQLFENVHHKDVKSSPWFIDIFASLFNSEETLIKS